MIEVYTHGGPSPRKVTIMLEECGLPYRWEWVNAYANEHKSPGFLAKNPNGRIPAMLDPDGPDGPLVMWESAAIVLYLAEKTGKFLPKSGNGRYEVLKWASFQATHAPYLGGVHWYRMAAPTVDRYSIDKYALESYRIYKVIDSQLAHNPYVAGDDYSIADISLFPWIEYHDWHGQTLSDTLHLERWFHRMLERPAVQRGRSVPYPMQEYGKGKESDKARDHCEARLADPAYRPTRFTDGDLANSLNTAPIRKEADRIEVKGNGKKESA